MTKSKMVLETLNLDINDFFCVTIYKFQITLLGHYTPALLTKLTDLGYTFNKLDDWHTSKTIIDNIEIEVSLNV